MWKICDTHYDRDDHFRGRQPFSICYRVLRLPPPSAHVELLDTGCGEGRNAVFFAGNGYRVAGLDLSEGIEKTLRYAPEGGTEVRAFWADLPEYRLSQPFDVVFSTGRLHYVPEEKRSEILTDYHDWLVEYFSEDIFDCKPSGVEHQHAVNRIIAGRPSG